MYKPIEMILWIDREGRNHPIKFKIYEEDDAILIQVVECLEVDDNRIVGIRRKIYNAKVQSSDREFHCNLMYEIDSGIWLVQYN